MIFLFFTFMTFSDKFLTNFGRKKTMNCLTLSEILTHRSSQFNIESCISIISCEFIQITSVEKGGALFIESESIFTLNSSYCMFYGCKSLLECGNIYASGKNIEFSFDKTCSSYSQASSYTFGIM